jgi:UDP-N-acetylglucosamine 4-epimerase
MRSTLVRPQSFCGLTVDNWITAGQSNRSPSGERLAQLRKGVPPQTCSCSNDEQTARISNKIGQRLRMNAYAKVEARLIKAPRKWVVTGAAGFIGSHLVERLLHLGQSVVGLDNFSTGRRWVIDGIMADASSADFTFIEGDIRSAADCARATNGASIILHQAALGSVPRSVSDPYRSHESNVDGFLRVMLAARDAGVQRVVYASSSSVYGDHPVLPKEEGTIGRQLSPYAATKRINEIYADVLSATYALSVVGLRYFNVFGPRQDPDGPYAAVIPRWIDAMLGGVPCSILGDGDTTRDFCFVECVVQANILAATCDDAMLMESGVLNIACGERISLNELHSCLAEHMKRQGISTVAPVYGSSRVGDVRHSLADIARARRIIGYEPTVRVREGLGRTVDWYTAQRR